MNVRGCVAATALLVAGVVPLTAAGAAQAAPAGGPRSLCAPPADTVGPTANGVTFSRASVDLDTGSKKESVSVMTQDTSGNGAPSGVARVRIEIGGDHYSAAPKLTLVSGTPASGTWHGTFAVSKYAHPGTYGLEDLTVTDADGNTQDYPGYGDVDGPNALSLHPADDPTFQVTGTPATRPRRKPAGTLRSFAQSTTAVNSTAAARPVRFTARFSAPTPHRVSVTLNSAHPSKSDHYFYRRVSLSNHHGTWTGTLRIARWLGDQHLQTSVSVQYGMQYRPRSRDYDSTKLHHLHFDHDVTVHSGTDRSDPRLTALSISPTPIDSTTGSERVTVTARASDTGSGVNTIDVFGSIHNGTNGVAAGAYPYAASGIGYLSSQELHVRLRKSAHGGWTGTTEVRQCVPSGTYKLTADTDDVAGNRRFYSSKQLGKAHLTSTVEVTSKHGDVVAPDVYSAATYGADHAVFLNFSEGVARVDTSTLTLYALAPRATRYRSPLSISAIDCSNGTDHVACSGSGGLVASAELTVPALKPGQKYEVYANLNQVVPQLTDGNGNPLDWSYAAAEVLDS